MSSAASPGPITVAVVNDFELVVRGVAAMLQPYADRVTIAELDANLGVSQDVDIALYDTFSMPNLEEPVTGNGVEDVTHDPKVRRTVLYTWGTDPALVAKARARGFDATLAKNLDALELVEALERVHAGLPMLEPSGDPAAEPRTGDWPGRREGLTAREAEIVVLVTEGLSNNEIAARTYLSINSVKSYIRTAYRTMGVTTRSQAILWGIDHGFARDRARVRPMSDAH
ncbi:MAG TPA: helix-turn-helix transcriptional regulator [Micrococcales bacterium]|uniref:response regulator transcription factor n=1 Tax=Miniimonas arenae TaxID=676201 RepID=UPI000ED661AB|nr:response regulator transcription factor [Miniimonas arenae]HCX85481.1 helix-turn-helix transcriptional regulator [Micrococcales bacterium]